MEIASSDIHLSSQHSSLQQQTLQQSLKAWVGNQRPDFEAAQGTSGAPAAAGAMVSLSQQGLAASQADSARQASAADPQSAMRNDPRYHLIIMIVEAFTGRKINLLNPADFQTQAAAVPQKAGFGVEFDRSSSSTQTENTRFSAQGTIKTADGKSIDFNLDLSMSSSHTEQNNSSVRIGDAVRKDPLVINFGGTAAQLTDTKFSFDLNSNGQNVNMSFVGPNSGFLALDKNGDGKINNGSELFGPSSGNGFQELAAYDSNKDGWIDSRDPVFQKLRIWSKDSAGKDSVSTLTEKNIGAIYLGNVSTQFDIKNAQNQSNGQIQSSGIYINDQGGAGTVQHVDLAV